jgi:hypothetical protein
MLSIDRRSATGVSLFSCRELLWRLELWTDRRLEGDQGFLDSGLDFPAKTLRREA